MSVEKVSAPVRPSFSDVSSFKTDKFTEAPAIRLLFDGLMTICFGPNQSHCQIGIPKDTPNHALHIKLDRTFAGETKPMTGLTGFDAKDIALELPARVAGIKTFESGAFSGDAKKDHPRDFRWLVDLEGPEFHDQKLPIKAGAFRQFITLNSGVFYNHLLSELAIDIKEAATGKVLNSRNVSTVTGVNIDLQDGEQFIIHDGNGQRLILPAEPGVTYTISFDNLCPEANSLLPNLESDFKLYYTIFDVPADQQLDLDLPLAEKEKIQKAIASGMDEATLIKDFGSHKVPCENVYLSQTTELTNE